MQTIFDGTTTPYGFEAWSLFGLIPLAICLFDRFVRKKPWSLMFLAIAFVALVVINGILNWDIYRIRAMMKSGDGIEVTRGAVTQHWSITQRVRDMSREGIYYKTIIGEGFDIGPTRFQWKRGESFSPATFSNSKPPRLALADGQLVEVTWFTDAADNDSRRIIRLKM